MKQILIYGSKSFAQLLSTILDEDFGVHPKAFIDDFSKENSVNGVPILSLSDAIKQYGQESEILLGVGYSNLPERLILINKLKGMSLKLHTLVHPTSVVSKSAVIGEGSIVMAQCHVAPGASLGIGCVLWPHVNVSHDSQVGSNSFLSPSSVVCGFSKLGQSVFIGANSTVVNNQTVPDGTFVKAGTLFVQKERG